MDGTEKRVSAIHSDVDVVLTRYIIEHIRHIRKSYPSLSSSSVFVACLWMEGWWA